MIFFRDLIHKIRDSAIEKSTTGRFTKTALISFYPPNKHPESLDKYSDTTFKRLYSGASIKTVARIILLTAPQNAKKHFAKFLTTHCNQEALSDNFSGMSIPEIAEEAFSVIRNAVIAKDSGAEENKLLSRRDIARYLGVSIPVLRSWIREKNLPCFKIGGVMRFRQAEVNLWLEKYRYKQ